MGAGVLRDVVLRIRSSRTLVRASEHGIEPDGFFVCAALECSAGGDNRTPNKLDASGANGAVTCRAPAVVSRGPAPMTAAPGLSCSQHQPQQSGRQRRRRRRLAALGHAFDRARCAGACAAASARPPTGSAFMANTSIAISGAVGREGLRVS